MNNDKELLRLAALAAGLMVKGVWVDGSDCFLGLLCKDGTPKQPAFRWNPLSDDGDALRLAVQLSLQIEQMYLDGPSVCVEWAGCWAIEKYNGDRLKATRRAIVKCAAEVGRFTPSA